MHFHKCTFTECGALEVRAHKKRDTNMRFSRQTQSHKNLRTKASEFLMIRNRTCELILQPNAQVPPAKVDNLLTKLFELSSLARDAKTHLKCFHNLMVAIGGLKNKNTGLTFSSDCLAAKLRVVCTSKISRTSG